MIVFNFSIIMYNICMVFFNHARYCCKTNLLDGTVLYEALNPFL